MQTTETDKKIFGFIAEKSSDIIDVFDKNLIRIYINPSITKYTGVPADYYLGNPVSRNPYFPDAAEVYIHLIKKALQNKEQLEAEALITTITGEKFFIISVYPQLAGSTIERVFLIFRDITELKNKEFLLTEFNNKFFTAAEALLQPFAILVPMMESDRIIDFRYDYINETGASVNGIASEQTVGRRLLDLFPLHKELGTFKAFCEVYKTGLPYKETLRYTGRAGSGIIDGYFIISAAKIKGGIVVTWQDVTDVVSAQQKLQKSEERLYSAFNANPVAMVLTDPEGAIIRINRRFKQLLGYSKKEVIGKTPAELNLIQDPETIQKTEISIKTKEPLYRFNSRVRAKDGSIFDVIFSTVPMETPDTLNYLFTLVDITKQKELEKSLIDSLQEKEILLKEIHHRVKNNLQIISSLLNLQSSVTESQQARDIISETQNRVHSIALMHENLYKNKSLSAIKLDDYISDMVNRLHQTYCSPGKIILTSVEASNINVDLKQCLSIGLIINELVTNSYKYAFKNTPRGEIKISAGPVDGRNLLLKVSDDGIGLPDDVDVNQPGTLGLQLVSILAHQLDGKLNYRNNNGAEFKILFPLKP